LQVGPATVTIAVVAAEGTASALVAIVAVIEDPAARLAAIAVCAAIVNDAVAPLAIEHALPSLVNVMVNTGGVAPSVAPVPAQFALVLVIAIPFCEASKIAVDGVTVTVLLADVEMAPLLDAVKPMT